MPHAAERTPCPKCGSTARRFVELIADRVSLSSHLAGQTQRNGMTVGYSETAREGTAASADIEGGQLIYRIAGASPQGELDTMDTVRRFVAWLNQAEKVWSEPRQSDLEHTDAVAGGAGVNARGTQMRVQVVRAIIDSNLWHGLSIRGEHSTTLRIDDSATHLWAAVEKKATKIDKAARHGIVLILDANRCPGQAFPEVVHVYRQKFSEPTKSMGFAGVYVVGPTSSLISALY